MSPAAVAAGEWKEHSMQSESVATWQNDWLYALVLRKAQPRWEQGDHVPEEEREERRKGEKTEDYLIGEWSSAEVELGMCRGTVVRAWMRDQDGLRQISLEEYEQHRAKIGGLRFPFVLMQFHILSNRERVVLGKTRGMLAGWGRTYLVVEHGDNASLEPDPAGGAWIS